MDGLDANSYCLSCKGHPRHCGGEQMTINGIKIDAPIRMESNYFVDNHLSDLAKQISALQNWLRAHRLIMTEIKIEVDK